MDLISVKDRLPTLEEAQNILLGFHEYSPGKLSGRIVFYSPKIGFAVISESGRAYGEYRFVNVNSSIDFWAICPEDWIESGEE